MLFSYETVVWNLKVEETNCYASQHITEHSRAEKSDTKKYCVVYFVDLWRHERPFQNDKRDHHDYQHPLIDRYMGYMTKNVASVSMYFNLPIFLLAGMDMESYIH